MIMAAATNQPPNAAGGALTRVGTAVSPANASAQLRFNTSGIAETAPTNGVFSTEFTWKTDLTRAASEYEVECTPTSGSFSTSAAGSGVYVGLGSSRTWVRNRTTDGAGSTAVSGTFSIRHVASGAIVATGTFSLTAQVTV